ncbi:hypothetical protein SAMN05661012_04079 [Chitinophaga sancti]|uniref:Uncharacterized protein n=1 Tax=Chitinophaga sancti TaxID=1004 RepID=A0A1K1RPZ3_9BACT|nr:hypothetical protein SAMN05661012_04079 [Chitinophaga sancti]
MVLPAKTPGTRTNKSSHKIHQTFQPNTKKMQIKICHKKNTSLPIVSYSKKTILRFFPFTYYATPSNHPQAPRA